LLVRRITISSKSFNTNRKLHSFQNLPKKHQLCYITASNYQAREGLQMGQYNKQRIHFDDNGIIHRYDDIHFVIIARHIK